MDNLNFNDLEIKKELKPISKKQNNIIHYRLNVLEKTDSKGRYTIQVINMLHQREVFKRSNIKEENLKDRVKSTLADYRSCCVSPFTAAVGTIPLFLKGK